MCCKSVWGLGEANYDSQIVRINVDLYTPRNEEDVRQLVGVFSTNVSIFMSTIVLIL